MSSSGEKLSLGSRLSSNLLSKISNVATKACNLEEHIKKLEEEKRKINDSELELELPLCLEILNDAISFLRDEKNKRCLEIKRCFEMDTKPLLKDLNEECREEDGIDLQVKKKNKNSVSSSFQLWKPNDLSLINTNKLEIENKEGKSLTGFSMLSPEVSTPKVETGLALGFITSSSMIKGGRRGITTSNSVVSVSHQGIRKQRRSWTPELHNRFLNALDKLGGAGVATPKQIREHMQEEGLTNDEVKSHLQKYRLHIRKPCSNPEKQVVNVLGFNLWNPQEEESAKRRRRRRNSSESDSPQGPLQLTGGDSIEEEDIEDAKSESFDELERLRST